MAILKVARMGHPTLRKVAKPITEKELKKPEFQQFIDDMIETMYEYDGIGLAAPQVHRSLRLSVVDIKSDNPRYPKQVKSGLHIFINPVWVALTEETNTYWEACLSVPGLRGLVARPNQLRVDFMDRNGKRQSIEASDFMATVLQHEFDHLDGKLYIDRLVDTTKLVFDQEYEKYWLPHAKDVVLDE